MYLTRLTLEPRSAQARRDLSDAYDMHRTLARAFVESAEKTPSRFLWRLESGSNPWASPIVLVQSQVSGNWSALQSLSGYLQRPPENKELELTAFIECERRYRFRLLANPTVTRDGKRYGLRGEDDQLDWLRRQGKRYGFDVESALVTESDLLDSRRKGGASIRIQRARFEGILIARSTDSLRQALINGIGPAKAFGCGMLSLVPY